MSGVCGRRRVFGSLARAGARWRRGGERTAGPRRGRPKPPRRGDACAAGGRRRRHPLRRLPRGRGLGEGPLQPRPDRLSPARGHTDVACGGCHPRGFDVPVADTCAGCHRDRHAGEFGLHCEGCHDEQSWRPLFQADAHRRTNFPLVGKHALIPCQQCHGNMRDRTFVGAPLALRLLSPARFRPHAATSIDHATAGFSRECQSCHNTWRFWPARVRAHDACFRVTGAARRSAAWAATPPCPRPRSPARARRTPQLHRLPRARLRAQADGEHRGTSCEATSVPTDQCSDATGAARTVTRPGASREDGPPAWSSRLGTQPPAPRRRGGTTTGARRGDDQDERHEPVAATEGGDPSRDGARRRVRDRQARLPQPWLARRARAEAVGATPAWRARRRLVRDRDAGRSPGHLRRRPAASGRQLPPAARERRPRPPAPPPLPPLTDERRCGRAAAVAEAPYDKVDFTGSSASRVTPAPTDPRYRRLAQRARSAAATTRWSRSTVPFRSTT